MEKQYSEAQDITKIWGKEKKGDLTYKQWRVTQNDYGHIYKGEHIVNKKFQRYESQRHLKRITWNMCFGITEPKCLLLCAMIVNVSVVILENFHCL